jgi:crotonobetaine/carnitine-CoA ligase
MSFAAHVSGHLGVGSGSRVLIFLGNCAEARWVVLGTQSAGLIPVLLNRNHKGAVLHDMARASKAVALVTDVAGIEGIPADVAAGMKATYLVDGEGDVSGSRQSSSTYALSSIGSSGKFEPVSARPTDVAFALYTSGTTGRSKGALIPHNMVARGSVHLAMAFGFNDRDVHHLWMPPYHISGQMHLFHAVVASGGEVALFPKFSSSKFWDEVREAGATRFGCFANAIRFLLDAPESPDDRNNTLINGLVGELQPSIKHPFEKRFDVRLYDSFGMTECEPMTLTYHPDVQIDFSCGKACEDFEIAIVDEEDNVLPPNQTGQIVSRPKKPGMMLLGYDDNPAETVRRWRNLWWHTEDFGRLDEDGNLFFLGRLKDMIRYRGENISALELEMSLTAHPEIRECAALGVTNDAGEEEVKVFVRLVAESTLEPKSIHAYCKSAMASFMVPRFIQVISQFPYTYNGKIDKKALRELPGEPWDAGRDHVRTARNAHSKGAAS